jgi:hypothetical protein
MTGLFQPPWTVAYDLEWKHCWQGSLNPRQVWHQAAAMSLRLEGAVSGSIPQGGTNPEAVESRAGSSCREANVAVQRGY